MSFDMSTIKTVVELYDESQVNSFLNSGWFLLSVGFNTVDGENEKTYILGNTEPQKPFSLSPDSRLEKLMRE